MQQTLAIEPLYVCEPGHWHTLRGHVFGGLPFIIWRTVQRLTNIRTDYTTGILSCSVVKRPLIGVNTLDVF